MDKTYPMSDTSGSPSPRNAKSEIIDQLKISVANCSEFVPTKQAFAYPDYRSLSPLNKLASSVQPNLGGVASSSPALQQKPAVSQPQTLYYPVPQQAVSPSPPPRVYSPYPYGQSESPPPYPYAQSESPPPYMQLQNQNTMNYSPQPQPHQFVHNPASYPPVYQQGHPMQSARMNGGTEIHVYHHHHHHPQGAPLYPQ